MVPYANQQQSTDFTESTCTSRAGSKVRFIRPPEMAPPELATGPGHPDCHSENSPSLPGVTQSRSRKEKKSSSELPRVLHEDTLRSLEGQSSYNVRKIWTEKGDDSLVANGSRSSGGADPVRPDSSEQLHPTHSDILQG